MPKTYVIKDDVVGQAGKGTLDASNTGIAQDIVVQPTPQPNTGTSSGSDTGAYTASATPKQSFLSKNKTGIIIAVIAIIAITAVIFFKRD